MRNQLIEMTDMKENFHAEVGERLVSQLPIEVKHLFQQWRNEKSLQIRGIQQGDDEIPETTALIFEFPNDEQMQQFNQEYGEKLFDLFDYFRRRETLLIDVVFITGNGCGTGYSWMVKAGCRFPIPTQWRQAND